VTSLTAWHERFTAEIERAQAARAQGNEGMARVCSRRAVGIVIGEYLSRRDLPVNSASAYERMKLLTNLPDLPPQVRQVTAHFMQHVTPDHTLPVEADLIAEAGWLAGQLLGSATPGLNRAEIQNP